MLLQPPPPLSRRCLFAANHAVNCSSLHLFPREVLSFHFLRPAAASASGDADAFTECSGYLFQLGNSEADSLREYNVSKIASIYRKRPLLVLRRLIQTGATLGKWFALRYIDGILDRSELMFKVRAEELRKILLQLGPAYKLRKLSHLDLT